MEDCERCDEIREWLLKRSDGTTARCPICGTRYKKSRLAIQGGEGRYQDVTLVADMLGAECCRCDWKGQEDELLVAGSMSGTLLCPRCERACIRSRRIA